MDEIDSGEYEGGFQAPDIQSAAVKAPGTGCVAADYAAEVYAKERAKYRTVGELQELLSIRTGGDVTTKSRNRPALLKRLGLPDVPRPTDLPKTGKAAGDAVARKAVKAIVKAMGVSAKKLNGKRPGKPKSSKAAKGKPVVPKRRGKGKNKNIVKEVTEGMMRVAKKRAADRRATALSCVTAAMARKTPPSLRALCAELKERKIQRPRGGLDWLPSSIQSLMRQATAAKGK
jgi:hypothetical protein